MNLGSDRWLARFRCKFRRSWNGLVLAVFEKTEEKQTVDGLRRAPSFPPGNLGIPHFSLSISNGDLENAPILFQNPP